MNGNPEAQRGKETRPMSRSTGVQSPHQRQLNALSPDEALEEAKDRLTFARPNVVQVEFVALLGALQGALGGKEVAGRVEGLVVIAAHLQSIEHRGPRPDSQSPSLAPPSLPISEMGTRGAKQGM